MKFRAWLKDQKRMVNVDQYSYSTNTIVYNDRLYDDFVLMLSSGVLDDTETEIYEDDIVKTKYGYHKVELSDGRWMLNEDIMKIDLCKLKEKGEPIVVMGNIHKSGYLLEKAGN